MWPRLSKEANETIFALHAQGVPHRKIAEVVGCSRGHVSKVVGPAGRADRLTAGREVRPWTDEEGRRAAELRGLGWTVRAIAREMDRSESSVESQLNFRHDDGCRISVHETGQPLTVPEHVLAERDARLSRAPRDLTAAFFGDPLPGCSALDRAR